MLLDNYLQVGELKIINSWETLDLKTYYQIKDIISSYEDLDKFIKVLSVLANVKEDYWNQFEIKQIEDIYRNLPFLNTIPEPKVQDYYTINGKVYKLLKTREDLKWKQFIDLCHFLKDESMIQENIPTILAIILAETKVLPWKKRVFNRLLNKLNNTSTGRKRIKSSGLKLYEPEVCEYDAENLLERADEIFDHMNSVEAMGLFGFFLNNSQAFYALTQHYLELTIKEQLKLSKELIDEESVTNIEMRKIQRKIRSMKIFTENGIG